MARIIGEAVELEGGQRLITHRESECVGGACPIHRLTDHHMRDWPQNWRDDRGIMERVCKHGVGHPDPDDVLNTDRVHGCDGCCADQRKVQ